MKALNYASLSLLAGALILGANTTCGAKLFPDNKPKAGALTITTPTTPELQAADERVARTKQQLDTARKQLSAARALLRAAEADYRAARTEREALALKTHAQGLADASGLNAAQAPAKPADQVAASTRLSAEQQAPVPQGQDAGQARIQQGDFNAEPAPTDAAGLR